MPGKYHSSALGLGLPFLVHPGAERESMSSLGWLGDSPGRGLCALVRLRPLVAEETGLAFPTLPVHPASL